MNTTQKSTQKLKTAQKWRPTFTATAQATFPLDYPSMNDLRPAMMFIVETRNRSPHVKNIICGNICKAKTINVKLYIMFWLDFRNMIKSKNSNLLYAFEFWDLSVKYMIQVCTIFMDIFKFFFENLLNRFKKSM